MLKKHQGDYTKSVRVKGSSNFVHHDGILPGSEAAADTDKARNHKPAVAGHHSALPKGELEAAAHAESDPLSGAISYTAQAKSLVKDVLQPAETGRLTAD